MSRREFSTITKRLAFARSAGICECHRCYQLPTYRKGCGVKLGEGNIFYEHIDQDALGGLNDLSNCAVLSRTCWKLKTATVDLPTIAKHDRVRDRAQRIKGQFYKPLPGTKRSGIKLSMRPHAKPIDRRTGQPWGNR